jgi:hypothetical protein
MLKCGEIQVEPDAAGVLTVRMVPTSQVAADVALKDAGARDATGEGRGGPAPEVLRAADAARHPSGSERCARWKRLTTRLPGATVRYGIG